MTQQRSERRQRFLGEVEALVRNQELAEVGKAIPENEEIKGSSFGQPAAVAMGRIGQQSPEVGRQAPEKRQLPPSDDRPPARAEAASAQITSQRQAVACRQGIRS